MVIMVQSVAFSCRLFVSAFCRISCQNMQTFAALACITDDIVTLLNCDARVPGFGDTRTPASFSYSLPFSSLE